jgi:formate dehydrogenase
MEDQSNTCRAYKRRAGRSRRTFCRICEAACGLRVDVDATGQPVRLRPDPRHPISRGFVCAKGTRFLEVANHPDRLLRPLLRRPNGQYDQVSWLEALSVAAARLQPLLARHGPHAVGIYFGNPLAFHTMGALTMLAFMRALGTRNVFTAGSQDCNNKFVGAQLVHGSPFIHPIPDFEHTDLALMLGTNPAVSQSSFVHLEGGSTVFDRLVQRGARVIWVDPRRTESAQRWGEHLPVRPGTDIFLLLALLHALRDAYRPDPRVEGLERLLDLAAFYPLPRAAALTGIEPERLGELAEAIRHARRATFHMSVGVNQGGFGTLCYVALHALAYLSGHFDQRGGVLFHPLAVWLGELSRRYGVDTSSQHSRVGDFPSVLGTMPGGIMADEILTPGPEQIRALIVVGGNPVLSIPGAAQLQRALQELDFLVCLDLFQNQTGRAADLILPTTSWLERWDVAMSTVVLQQAGMIQYAGAVRRAPGDSRSETRILADLSLACGRPLFGHTTLARLWGRLPWDTLLALCSEIVLFPLRLWYRGGQGIPSPRPKTGHYLGHGPLTPGHRVRFWHADLDPERQRLDRYSAEIDTMALETGAGIADSTQPEISSRQPATEAYCTLICRRRRLGHNSWLHRARHDGQAEAEAWLAPQDLEALGLPHGGAVRLHTARLALQVLAKPVEEVMRGFVVMPHGLPEGNVNALLPTGLEMLEPLSGQHRMTGIVVRLTPVR